MQSTIINIDQMDDEGSADSISQILLSMNGVEEVRVSLRDCLASVQFDETRTSPTRMADRLASAGFPSIISIPTPHSGRASGCCGGCGGA